MTDPTPPRQAAPALAFVCRIRVAFDLALDCPSLSGRRGFLRAGGGRVEGPGLSGRILPQAGDWAVFRPDGVTECDIRLVIEAEGGAIVYLRALGVAATGAADATALPTAAPFRCTPRFDTARGPLERLTRGVYLGSGSYGRAGLDFDVWEAR